MGSLILSPPPTGLEPLLGAKQELAPVAKEPKKKRAKEADRSGQLRETTQARRVRRRRDEIERSFRQRKPEQQRAVGLSIGLGSDLIEDFIKRLRQWPEIEFRGE